MASVEGGSGMALECAWPYWMSRPEGIIQSLVNDGASIHPCGAIANDVHMNDGMFILSGPNMSGKSTVMRTVMATALLGNVGLPVPARSANVPQVSPLLLTI